MVRDLSPNQGMGVVLFVNPEAARYGLWARLSRVTTTRLSPISTLPDVSSKLRKILLGWACLYYLSIRLAISRYKELAMRVSCMSKSTFIPTIDESASM